MPRDNSNLHRAKNTKNDEFYTRYEDIEKEVENYTDQLEGKYVYCPCDDYRWSNFYKYFKNNFNRLKLRHLTATNYDLGDGAYRADFNGYEEAISRLDGTGEFQSLECTRIRDAADIIITNPPFSIFRDFFYWLGGGEFTFNEVKNKWIRNK